MKKLNLQLGSIKEMLTKEQMKKVSGGYEGCIMTIDTSNPMQCGTVSQIAVLYQPGICNSDCDCQTHADADCLNDNCCVDMDCGCK